MDGDGAGTAREGVRGSARRVRNSTPADFWRAFRGVRTAPGSGVDERPGWTRRQPARGGRWKPRAPRVRGGGGCSRVLRRTKTTGTAFCRAKVGACLPFGRSEKRMVSVIYILVAEVSRNRINTSVFIYTPFPASPRRSARFVRVPAARSLEARRRRPCVLAEAQFGTTIVIQRLSRPSGGGCGRSDAGGRESSNSASQFSRFSIAATNIQLCDIFSAISDERRSGGRRRGLPVPLTVPCLRIAWRPTRRG